jgi:hypothetical protein
MKEVITLTKQPDGSFAFELPEDKAAAEVELHKGMASAGILDKIPDWEIAGVPVGEAARSMVVAGVADAVGLLAVKFLPANLWTNTYAIALKNVLEIMLLNWHPVKDFIGHESVKGGSIILAYEGISSIFNARLKVYNALAGVVGKVGGTATTTTTNGNGNGGVQTNAGALGSSSSAEVF